MHSLNKVSHILNRRRDGHRKSDCRKGRHLYGADQNIGAGMTRRICSACSDVTIDLTGTYQLAQPVLLAHEPLPVASRR